MSGLVLITRPRQDALVLAPTLQQLGLNVLIEPMIDIQDIPFTLSEEEAVYSGLIFTSANAVRSFVRQSNVRDLPVYVVGKGTAEVVREFGFSTLESIFPVVSDLVGALRRQFSDQGHKLLYVRGEHISKPIQDLLKPYGVDIEEIIVYRAGAVSMLSLEVLSCLDQGRVDTVTFFSKRTAEIFAMMIEQYDRIHTLKDIKALCISTDVVESVLHLKWHAVLSAETPDRTGMLSLLQKTCVGQAA